MKHEITKQYLDKGKNLTPLNGKRPIKNNWSQLKLSKEEILGHNGNRGWVLGGSDLIIDVDKQNGGLDSYKKLVEDLKLDLEPTVNTPSGGFHVYLSIPSHWLGKSFHKTINSKYKGIDFLTKGSQAVIAGSETEKGEYVWADDLFGEFVQCPAPDQLLLEISYSNNDAVVSGNEDELGDFAGVIGGKSASWSEEDVVAMLEKLDPSMTNDEWVKVGQGLHDWSPVEGLTLWESWSKGGRNYTEGETAKRWKSFKLGGGVTLGTVSHMVKVTDKRVSLDIAEKLIDDINASDEITFRTGIVSKIKKAKLDDFDREKIVKVYQDKAKEFTGIRPAISQVRRELASSYSNSDASTEITIEDRPDWCNEWVYVDEIDCFVHSEQLKPVTANAFNMLNGKHVPFGEGGTKPSAIKYVSDRGLITVVRAMAYLPMYDEFICGTGKNATVNTFNKDSVPVAAEEYTEVGLATIEAIKNHALIMCNKQEYADIFLQWIAHQIQYPGKKILWAPLLQSNQGIGKSFFGGLLRTCLGIENVGVVSSREVTSDFTSWSTGKAVNILEEVKIAGHNRHEASNNLKSLITDSRIQVNKKNVAQYETHNVTNYICFTNYKTAIPLDKSDRRWFVIFCDINSITELEEHVGMDRNSYYDRLFIPLKTHGGELRKWLLEYPLTDEFLNMKQAPNTVYKESASATEDAGFLGFDSVVDALNQGGKFFNTEAVCIPELMKHLSFEFGEHEIGEKEIQVMLKKLNYSSSSDRGASLVHGERKRYWTKKYMDHEQIRKSLTESYEKVENQVDPFHDDTCQDDGNWGF